MKRIVLVDGNSLMYRAYYATAYTGNLMKNTKGLYTNAIYAFIKMIDVLLKQEYDGILVAFDAGKHTFRHDIVDTYKGGRSPMPDEFRQQIPHIKEYLHLSNVLAYEVPLYEADDIIGTISLEAEQAGYHVDIYSSDKDLLQLASDKTTVHMCKKGMSELEDFTPEHFNEVYGLNPIQMIDLKSLMGDASDNLAGIPGVGEKTAIKLLQEYKTLDGIIEARDSIKGKLGEKIREGYENAKTCQFMCTIKRDSPIEVHLADTFRKEADEEKLNDFYRYMEFHSMTKAIAPKKVVSSSYEVISDNDSVKKALLPGSYVVFEMMEYNYHKANLLYIGIKNEKGIFILKPELLNTSVDLQLFLADKNVSKNTFNLKGAKVYLTEHGYDLSGVTFDMMLASYVLNPQLDNSSIERICNFYEYTDIPYFDDIYGKGAKMCVPDDEILYGYITKKLIAIESLKPEMLKKLVENDQLKLLNDIEIPLASVLAKIEMNGMLIDKTELENQKVDLETEEKDLANKIYELAGIEFNISSPKQLGEVLFERLGLPVVKKTKNGYSTDADVLNYLASQHEIVPLILRYRSVTKLLDTYINGIAEVIYPDGKVHTIFEQALTATGRLSSIEPNIQNIPIRTPDGKKIRKFFIPEEGHKLFSADYSQVELRILSHMSGCKPLIDAFNNGDDIHSVTAQKVFHVDEVTPELRRKAKAVNFGIVYGISAFGLGEQVDMSPKEAKQFIDEYFALYPEIEWFMNSTVEFAKANGYVVTLSNRRRYIPELNSPIYMQREFGKRTAMNAPIQGSAADLIKIAMINVDRLLEEKNLKSKIICQVHDELVFDVAPGEEDILKDLVIEEMTSAMRLEVKLDADYGFGLNWMEVK